MSNDFLRSLPTKPADWPHDIRRQIEVGEAGLVFGAGTLLARVTKASNWPVLEADRDRILTLLSVAQGHPVSSDVLPPLAAACTHWQRGDKVLANLRLIFGRLPRLADPADAYRMRLAEYLLDEGFSPLALMKELGLDPSQLDLAKYDQNQPRVPAGNGDQSGRWGSVTGTFVIEDSSPAPSTQTPTPTTTAPSVNPSGAAIPAALAIPAASLDAAGTLASGLFAAASTGGEFLAALAAFASSIGTGIVAGAIIIPSPNTQTTEGDLPGDSELRYSLNGDEGVLSLTHQTDSGTEVVATARLGHDGIFFETETGIPIARDVGGSVVFDAASLANVAPEIAGRAQTGTRAQTDTDNPQLCPAPSKDMPHGASERAKAYQELISALNNPQRPLKRGMAVSLINPMTGRRVVYDDCRESDGTTIEAKGPGYAKLLRYKYFYEKVLPGRWTNQATRQILASGGRNLDWFFAESEAATRAREVFHDTPSLKRINVLHVPAVVNE